VGPGGTRGNVPLFFEAQLAPHLYVFNGLWHLGVRGESGSSAEREACKSDQDCAANQWHFVSALSITPEVRLRMVFSTDANENHSAPVRPPSFMPRLDYQLFFYKRPQSLPFWARSQDVRGLWLVSPSLAIGHHSNGQEYCRFDPTGTTKDPDECAPWDGDLSKVNFRSGDFSTNYLIERLHVAWIELDPHGYETRRYAAGVVFEQNPKDMFGASGLNEQEYSLYGPWRFGLQLETTWNTGWTEKGEGTLLAGQWGVSFDARKFLGTGDGVASYSVSAEVRRTFERLSGFGAFARFYSGQDYLNILFVQKIPWTFQVGVVFDGNERLRVRF
jgi:hypothetical protein